MTPLGDGHGPDAPKHPASRFLTTPEGTARVAAFAAAHAKALEELTNPVEQVHAALLIIEKGASVLSATAFSSVAPFPVELQVVGNAIKSLLPEAETALRGK